MARKSRPKIETHFFIKACLILKMFDPFNHLKGNKYLFNEQVRNNCDSTVIASKAKQSNSLNNSRLLRRYASRNDIFVDLRTEPVFQKNI
jgi:hypothetical protein